MHRLTCLLLCFSIIHFSASSQTGCLSNEAEIKVIIVPDQYPNEISWDLQNGSNGTILASGGFVGDTLCVDTSICVVFNIYDSYGDGIFSPGGYSVYYNGVLIQQRVGYDFGAGESVLLILVGTCFF